MTDQFGSYQYWLEPILYVTQFSFVQMEQIRVSDISSDEPLIQVKEESEIRLESAIFKSLQVKAKIGGTIKIEGLSKVII